MAASHQIKEFQQVPPCNLCEKAQPVIICTECHQSLCQECKNQHDQIQNFSKHNTANLCIKHFQAVTHMCKQCRPITPLCMKCMIVDHNDHNDQFITFSEGIALLEKRKKPIVESLKEQAASLKQAQESTREKIKETHDVKVAVTTIKTNLQEKINKLDSVLKDIEEIYEPFGKGVLQKLVKAKKDCATLFEMLHNPNDVAFVAQFKECTEKSELVLKQTKAALGRTYTGAPYTLASLVKEHGLAESIQDPFLHTAMMEPKMLLQVTPDDRTKLQRPIGLAMIGKESVAVADFELKHVLRIDKFGHYIGRFQPNEDKAITGISVHGNYLYITQATSILQQPILASSKEGKKCVKPKIKDMWKSCVVVKSSKAKMLISSCIHCSVFEYLPAKDKVTIAVEHLSYPTFISVLDTDVGTRYIVTESGKHRINVYTDEWKQLSTIGEKGSGDGQLEDPEGVAVLSKGVIVVADKGNNRLSCFTLDGTFVRQLLTRRDGIKSPYALAYSPPDLWITEYDGLGHVALKLFRLYTQE